MRGGLKTGVDTPHVTLSKFRTLIDKGLKHAVCSAYSADYGYVALGSLEGAVEIWRFSPGPLQTTYAKLSDSQDFTNAGVTALGFSPAPHRYLAVGACDHRVYLYSIKCSKDSTDTPTLEYYKPLKGHGAPVSCVKWAFTNKENREELPFLCTCGEDFKVVVWDTKAGTPVKKFIIGSFQGREVAWAPDNSKIVGVTHELGIQVWLLGNKMKSFYNLPPSNCVNFASDGLHVITGGKDKFAIIWNTVDGEIITRLGPHADEVVSCGFLQSDCALTSCASGNLYLWCIVTGKLLGNVEGEEKHWILHVAESRAFSWIVTMSERPVVDLWAAKFLGGRRRSFLIFPDQGPPQMEDTFLKLSIEDALESTQNPTKASHETPPLPGTEPSDGSTRREFHDGSFSPEVVSSITKKSVDEACLDAEEDSNSEEGSDLKVTPYIRDATSCPETNQEESFDIKRKNTECGAKRRSLDLLEMSKEMMRAINEFDSETGTDQETEGLSNSLVDKYKERFDQAHSCLWKQKAMWVDVVVSMRRHLSRLIPDMLDIISSLESCPPSDCLSGMSNQAEPEEMSFGNQQKSAILNDIEAIENLLEKELITLSGSSRDMRYFLSTRYNGQIKDFRRLVMITKSEMEAAHASKEVVRNAMVTFLCAIEENEATSKSEMPCLHLSDNQSINELSNLSVVLS
mmetsp:Transcript_4458/g.6014  ORF Transcript_4458/g.6014 Transcript_4458/m.6014 type:complete len:684 (-) Transcript_4458:87-2138(-)